MAPAREDPVETIQFQQGAFGAFHRATSFVGTAEVQIRGGAVYAAWDGELMNLEIPRAVDMDVKQRQVGTFLVDLYTRFGTGMFSRLLGDFAVAIWDPREKRLVAACDRFRVRPLYYYSDGFKVFFASKLRAFSERPEVQKKINPEAIIDYLDLSVIPTPATIYQDVKKLPPGHMLVWQSGSLETKRYWDIRYAEDATKTEADYAFEVRNALDSSVDQKIALADDGVDIGAFLSGGIDSTTIVGLLHRRVGDRVKAFTIGFSEDGFNEMRYARIGARHFGVKHYEYVVSPSDTVEFLPRMASEYDEPFGNSSAVPTYYCAKLARESGVRTIFAGDGGDELFAGNERYAHDRKFQLYHKVPSRIRQSLIDPIGAAVSDSRIRVLERAGKYIRRANIPCPDRWFSYSPSRTIPMFEEMLTDEMRAVANSRPFLAPYKDVFREAVAESEINRFLYLDLKAAIADNDLVKVTRMAELAGINVQFPFLCHQLADLSGAIPSRMKMRGSRLRSFFKNAFSELLPSEIIEKKKHGFGLPIPVWLRTESGLRDFAADLVLSPRAVQRGYFRSAFLKNIFELHRSDTTSFYGSIIWNLMMLELWHRRHWDK
jgi:asparagine synthase (glutamine-hydrolysing)